MDYGHQHPMIVDAYFYGVVRAGDEFLDVGAYKGLTKLHERLAKNKPSFSLKRWKTTRLRPKAKFIKVRWN